MSQDQDNSPPGDTPDHGRLQQQDLHGLSESARQAIAILAVDDIRLSAFGLDVLRRKSAGLITYEEAKAEIRAHALAGAAARAAQNKD